MTDLWLSDIFPLTLDDYEILYPNVVNKLNAYVKNQSMPHLLFTGKEGLGKTHLALAFARSMTSEQNIKLVFASDPIKKEEEKYVKDLEGDGKYSKNHISNYFAKARIIPHICTPAIDKKIKIIIIKDFDTISQAIFRRLLEKYNKNARFILISKNISKIITPMLSRCATIPFAEPSDKYFDAYLESKIYEFSKIKMNPQATEILRIFSQKNFILASKSAQECFEKYGSIASRDLKLICVDKKMDKLKSIINTAITTNIYDALSELSTFMQYNIVEFADISKCIMDYLFKLHDYDLQLNISTLVSDFDYEYLNISNRYIFFSYVLVKIYNILNNTIGE